MSKQRLLFATTIFLASFLLFLVEPIAARQLLPVLGGSAAVWITCLVFFQTALLLGYMFAHGLARRQQKIAYVALLVASCAFVIGWATSPPLPVYGSTHPPSGSSFRLLGTWIGLPFLMLSATSPLLQVWWARLENSEIPYRLYALSNVASLLALAAYPSLVEPNLTLHMQRLAWCCGFILFAVLAGVLASRIQSRSAAPEASPAADASAPLSHKILWFLLPMGASMQLSAITGYITANVAAIPLLWILPLGVYLITTHPCLPVPGPFALGIIARVMVVMLGALAYSLSKTNTTWPLWLSLTFFLIELFFACIFCHSAATCLPPATRIGGHPLLPALRRRWRARLLPHRHCMLRSVFNINLDLPITFLVTALLALGRQLARGSGASACSGSSPASACWSSPLWSAAPCSTTPPSPSATSTPASASPRTSSAIPAPPSAPS